MKIKAFILAVSLLYHSFDHREEIVICLLCYENSSAGQRR